MYNSQCLKYLISGFSGGKKSLIFTQEKHTFMKEKDVVKMLMNETKDNKKSKTKKK